MNVKIFPSGSLNYRISLSTKIQMAVSAITFVNAFYILRKSYEQKELYQAMKRLATLCIISPIDAEIINTCLDMQSKDFEDAVQYKSAQSIEADIIITRNKKTINPFK